MLSQRTPSPARRSGWVGWSGARVVVVAAVANTSTPPGGGFLCENMEVEGLLCKNIAKNWFYWFHWFHWFHWSDG